MKHLALLLSLFLSLLSPVARGEALPDTPVPSAVATVATVATVVPSTTTPLLKHPFRLQLDRTDKILLLSDLTVRSLDAWSTNRALGREAGDGRRFVEAGWPAKLFAEGHPAAVWAYSEAAPVGYGLLTSYLNHRRHGRVAKAAVVGEVVMDSIAVGGNLEQGFGSTEVKTGAKGRY